MGQAQWEATDSAANGVVAVGMSWCLWLFVWGANMHTGHEGGERQRRVMIAGGEQKALLFDIRINALILCSSKAMAAVMVAASIHVWS